MDPVIIMVGRPNEAVHDVELMPDIPAEELADAIAAAFGWDGTYDININGKKIGNGQTLAEVNAWDGSELTLVASNRPPRLKLPPKSAAGYRILKTSRLESLGAGATAPVESQERPDRANVAGLVVPESPTITRLSSPATSKK